ncbi:glutathione S-transferase family protein [Sphingomonas sp.]|uniref:glutathione S-transferase family protein n=1 Tax=Sphingomonas sp. TaxID=28214 RepID=UPI002C24419E|nr:glutathione S-transferase family protein [Sphingomonas sp.]HWK35713.1 glutathione S-transferase family protein [Sphingomonas sp.]
MAKDLTLYTNPQSRGRIARWMLEEVGADYETVVIDYAGAMSGEAYRAVNPMAKVPAIVHRGRTITECAAICAYLADAFPDAGMAPALDDRADYYRWLFFAAGPVEQAVTNHAVGWDPEAERQRMFGYGSYDRAIDALEGAVDGLGEGWLTGARFSAADVYVGAQLSWGTMFGTIPKRPAFVAFAERVQARPAAIRAAQLDDALASEQA